LNQEERYKQEKQLNFKILEKIFPKPISNGLFQAILCIAANWISSKDLDTLSTAQLVSIAVLHIVQCRQILSRII